jgi:exosortase/archaeosortase family protein
MIDVKKKLSKLNTKLLRNFFIWLILIFLIPFLLSYFIETTIKFNFFSFYTYLVAAILVYFIYNRKIINKYKLKINYNQSFLFGLISIIFFALFVYFKYFSNIPESYGLLILSIISQVLFTAFSAIALFGVSIFKDTLISLIFIGTSIYIYFILTLTAWANWEKFSKTAIIVVHFVLSKILGMNSSYGAGDQMSLSLNSFNVGIGAPCSGIESLVFFVTLFGLMVILDYKRLIPKRTAVIFLIGLIGTYSLNIIRLTVLMILGTRWPDFALGQFHSQAGWVMFAVFVLMLYGLSQKWITKKSK